MKKLKSWHQQRVGEGTFSIWAICVVPLFSHKRCVLNTHVWTTWPQKQKKYTDLDYRFGVVDVNKALTTGEASISNCVSIITWNIHEGCIDMSVKSEHLYTYMYIGVHFMNSYMYWFDDASFKSMKCRHRINNYTYQHIYIWNIYRNTTVYKIFTYV